MKFSKLSPKTQNLIGCGVLVLLIFLGIGGYAAWKAYSFFSRFGVVSEKNIPEQLREPRVLKGTDFLAKTEIYKLKKLSFSETVGKGASAKDEKEKQKIINSESAKDVYGFDDIKVCGEELIAVGKFGGYVFGLDGSLKREILFEPKARKMKFLWSEQETYNHTLQNLRIIDFENDGQCEFISEGLIDGVTIFNNQGNVTWRYGERDINLNEVWNEKSEAEQDKEVYVTNVSVVDLDEDGIAEYIISRKNEGIRAFDFNKNEKWFQPDEYPTAGFRMVDIDGDGAGELLEFQGMSSKIRDKATGAVLKKIEITGGTDGILMFEDDRKKKLPRLFDITGNKFALFDFNNKAVMETEAPLSEIKIPVDKSKYPSATPIYVGNNMVAMPDEMSGDESQRVYQPKAVFAVLRKDKPKYLVVLAPFIDIPRAHLYIYASDGNLVYHELLPERAETLAAIPAANSNEEIIIGGKDTIWKFTAK
jgi:hypothetical protein